MPDELFRAAHSHNSAPHSDIVGQTPHFYPHVGAGHKGIKPLMCKHNVVYDLLTLASLFILLPVLQLRKFPHHCPALPVRLEYLYRKEMHLSDNIFSPHRSTADLLLIHRLR